MDLDMSDAFDDDIMDTFTMRRQEQTLVLGRTQITNVDTPGVFGVITTAGKNDLDRLPQGTTFTTGISIVTQTRLHAAGWDPTTSKEYQPDLVYWNDEWYLVIHVDRYGHVGSGFWQVLAESTSSRSVESKEGVV